MTNGCFLMISELSPKKHTKKKHACEDLLQNVMQNKFDKLYQISSYEMNALLN